MEKPLAPPAGGAAAHVAKLVAGFIPGSRPLLAVAANASRFRAQAYPANGRRLIRRLSPGKVPSLKSNPARVLGEGLVFRARVTDFRPARTRHLALLPHTSFSTQHPFWQPNAKWAVCASIFPPGMPKEYLYR